SAVEAEFWAWLRRETPRRLRATSVASRETPGRPPPRDFAGRAICRKISIEQAMSIAASVNEVLSRPVAPLSARIVSAVEVLLVYAGVLLYIWRWQFSYPRLWVALLAVMVLSHLARGERPRDLGLTFAGLRSNAEKVLPLALAIYLPLVFYG